MSNNKLPDGEIQRCPCWEDSALEVTLKPQFQQQPSLAIIAVKRQFAQLQPVCEVPAFPA
jgi:hypothetical protein